MNKRGRKSKADIARLDNLTQQRANLTNFKHVLYTVPHVDGVRKIARVKQYKYLGVIIDQKLSLDTWCRKIASEVNDRV